MFSSREHLAQWFAKEESQIFQYIVDRSMDAILTTDAALRIVYVNSACEHLLGRSVTDQSLRSIWFEEDWALLDTVLDWVRVAGFFSAARLNGFRKIIDQYPGIEIVGSLAADWNRDKGRQRAEEFLRIHPPGSLDLIWAASSEMALGALDAVEAAGRQADVKIFSNDVTPESSARLSEGRLMAETHHGFAEWGWYGTKFGVMLALGLAVPPVFDTRPRTAYRGNAQHFYPTLELEPIDWQNLKSGRTLPEKIRIGWVQMAEVGVYQTATHFFEKAAAEARQQGINVEIITRIPATPEDFSGQAAIIEDFIAEGVDVIAFSTIIVDSVKEAIHKANAQGIPVIIVNQLETMQGVEVASYIGFDNSIAGEISGYAVVDYLGGLGVLGKGQAIEVAPATHLDLAWWQALYEDQSHRSQEIKGRVAIIEGIAGGWRGENRLLRHDGSSFYADTITFPIHNHAGQLIGLVASFRDASERIHAEDQLQLALDKERQLNELRERFVLNMSHEIRTPLTIINNSANLLYKYHERLSEEDRLKRLTVIMDQVQEMIGMLENIQTVHRADDGYLEFTPEPVDLHLICETISEGFAFTAANITMDFQFNGNCEQAVMDQALLFEIVTNLLSNAVKYSPQGGTIHFHVTCSGDTVHFKVQDHGIGIPAADQGRIFENFHRASNVDTIRGAGLGLAIVRHAVKLHGGIIHVESILGSGSTFTISLPLRSVPQTG